MSDALEDLRRDINEVDRALVEKLDERARIVKEIGDVKKEQGLDLYAPGREKSILQRLERISDGDFPLTSLRHVFREIIATCRNLEKPVTVAYLGPEATFTHAATQKQFGRKAELKPLETVSDVFEEVEREAADFGLVPIESSAEGAVRHTLDRFLDSPLLIYSECYLRIHLCLLSLSEAVADVKTVLSHPQALSQARTWLRSHVPEASIQETNSTAEAALTASTTPQTAAVASEVAADIYDLNILARNIETRQDNITRFLVLSHASPGPTGDDKTTVTFSVQDRPGALHEVLGSFASRDINLTKIESRPSREGTWDYIFFVDFQGHKEDREIAGLIQEVRENTSFFKVLGSYPREEWFE